MQQIIMLYQQLMQYGRMNIKKNARWWEKIMDQIIYIYIYILKKVLTFHLTFNFGSFIFIFSQTIKSKSFLQNQVQLIAENFFFKSWLSKRKQHKTNNQTQSLINAKCNDKIKKIIDNHIKKLKDKKKEDCCCNP
jgi:hypothetical protein